VDISYNIIPETYIDVELTYSLNGNQTRFGSAFIDNSEIFVNNETINTNNLDTFINLTNNIETRIIRLKNITSNKTIFINLQGIVATIDGLNNASQVITPFEIKTINIDPNTI
jgi:hypothetical protein